MLFIVVVLSIPVYGYCIWSLFETEEAMLFMDRWRYKEEPEFSDLQIKIFKSGNILAIIFMTIYILIVAYDTFFGDGW